MTETKAAPWIHLPLDELFGKTLHDGYGRAGRNAAVGGDARIARDATFGQCLELAFGAGEAGAITLPALRPEDFTAGATLLLWLRMPYALFFRMDFGPQALGVEALSDHKNMYFSLRCGADRSFSYLGAQSYNDEWFLFAIALPPSGAPEVLSPPGASTSGPPPSTPAWTLVNPTRCPVQATVAGRAESGGFAQLRIYNRVLGAAEVEAIRQADLAGHAPGPGGGTEPLPISFYLENEEAAPVLYVDPPANAVMRLVVQSNTGAMLRLTPLGGEASPDNWHLRLTFRQGTLRNVDAIALGSHGWKLALSKKNEEDTLFLLSVGPPILPVAVVLAGVTADSRQGGRATRVELGYRNVTWRVDGSDVTLEGTRSQQLAVKRQWTPLDLANGWIQGIAGTAPECFRDSNGIVHLRGQCVLKVSKDHPWRGEMARPFELPPGYRPGSLCFFPGRAWVGGRKDLPIVPSHVVLSQQWAALYLVEPSSMGGSPALFRENDTGWEAVLYLDGISYGGEP